MNATNLGYSRSCGGEVILQWGSEFVRYVLETNSYREYKFDAASNKSIYERVSREQPNHAGATPQDDVSVVVLEPRRCAKNSEQDVRMCAETPSMMCVCAPRVWFGLFGFVKGGVESFPYSTRHFS